MSGSRSVWYICLQLITTLIWKSQKRICWRRGFPLSQRSFLFALFLPSKVACPVFFDTVPLSQMQQDERCNNCVRNALPAGKSFPANFCDWMNDFANLKSIHNRPSDGLCCPGRFWLSILMKTLNNRTLMCNNETSNAVLTSLTWSPIRYVTFQCSYVQSSVYIAHIVAM